MLSTVLSLSLLAIQSGASCSVPCAVDAIAGGSDEDAQGARLAALGRPGLWALHDAAKKSEGAQRGRLFDAIGRFASDEAEWALTIELKSGDLEGRAGAIRGLARMKRPKMTGAVLRQAAVEHPAVREAAVDFLIALGEAGAPHVARLISSGEDSERAIALAYSLRAPGADLSSSMFRVAELARSPNGDVAELAARVLAKTGGPMAAGELASIISDPETKEVGWMRAADLLASMGAEGRRELIAAAGRARDEHRRETISAVAAKGASREDIEAMIDMLDDPSPEKRAAARSILARTGNTGRELAKERLSRSLPELEAAIKEFLKSEPVLASDMEAKR